MPFLKCSFPMPIITWSNLTDIIGRLIVRRDDKEIRLVDDALLAEFRNRRTGKILLERLKAEATFGKPLVLSVLQTNSSAKRFYERLGLAIVEDADLHFSMRV